MTKYTYCGRHLGISTVRPIFLASVFFEVLTYLFLLCFDLAQLSSQVLLTPLIANAVFILLGAVAVFGTLRYVKKLLLLYSVWCLLHIMWIILCLLTSLHMIQLHRNHPPRGPPPNNDIITSEVLTDIAQWFMSTPIPYGYSMGWQLSHYLKIEAHTLVVAMLAWQFVIISISGIFAFLVRRAYLAEQRNWDGLDNWAI